MVKRKKIQTVKVVSSRKKQKGPSNVLSKIAHEGPKKKKEYKFVDLGSSNFLTLNTTGTVTLLNGLVEGTDVVDRIGRRIFMKSIQVKGWLSFINPTDFNLAGSCQFARILLVYDKQTNGAAPAYTDVIQGLSSAGTATNTFLDFKSMPNMDRFTIIRDHSFMVPSEVFGQNDNEKQWHINWYIPLKGIPTMYNASNGNVADIKTGGLFMLSLGSSTFTATPTTFTYNTRVVFTDVV